MIVCEAPHKEPEHSVFLAGGITGCPDWQKKAIKGLEKRGAHHLEVFNPRRPDYPENTPEIAEEQVGWEHHYLDEADTIAFWFPKEGACSITLFELGKFLPKHDKDLIISVHPKYVRRLDVEIQTKLERPHLQIGTNFEKHLDQIAALGKPKFPNLKEVADFVIKDYDNVVHMADFKAPDPDGPLWTPEA